MGLKLTKEFKQAVSAHNNRAKEPCANDNYNLMYGLGTYRGRRLVDRIADSEWGMLKFGKKVTAKVIERYYEGLLNKQAEEIRWAIEGWKE